MTRGAFLKGLVVAPFAGFIPKRLPERQSWLFPCSPEGVDQAMEKSKDLLRVGFAQTEIEGCFSENRILLTAFRNPTRYGC